MSAFAPITTTRDEDFGLGTINFESNGRVWGRFRDGLGGFVRIVGTWSESGVRAAAGATLIVLDPVDNNTAPDEAQGATLMGYAREADGEETPILCYEPGREGVTAYGLSRPRPASASVTPFRRRK